MAGLLPVGCLFPFVLSIVIVFLLTACEQSQAQEGKSMEQKAAMSLSERVSSNLKKIMTSSLGSLASAT